MKSINLSSKWRHITLAENPDLVTQITYASLNKGDKIEVWIKEELYWFVIDHKHYNVKDQTLTFHCTEQD